VSQDAVRGGGHDGKADAGHNQGDIHLAQNLAFLSQREVRTAMPREDIS
jgi:hypothetical protein